MPTLNKLEYLDETKQEIKAALNTEFNAGITDNDTFRSYVGKIQDIYTNWPKVTNEGTELSFTAKKGKMVLEPKGNTEQTTYTGKNLLSYTLNILKTINTQGTWNNNVYSYNGVDYTINEDLTIKTNGTASGASYLIINNDLNLTSGTDYKLNGCSTGGGVSTYAIRLYTGNNYVSQTGLDFPFTYESQNLVRINVFSGTNVNNLVFKPMVRLASITDDTYEPYVGGTASPNPDYPQDIKVVKGNNTINVHGKNLLDLSVIPASINRIETYNYNNNILTITGSDTSLTGNRYVRFDVSNYEIGKTYTISAENITNNSASDSYNIVAINSYNGSSNQALGYLRKNQLKTSFTIPSDIQQLRIYFYTIDDTTSTFTKIQLEQNSTNTTYQPYTSTDYAINLGNMEFCEIENYYDYPYKNNNKWYKKGYIGKVVLDGSEYWELTPREMAFSSANSVFPNNLSTGSITPSLSSHYIADTWNNVDRGNIDYGFAFGSRSILIRNKDVEDETDFKNWLSSNNVTVYFPLDTPTDIEITDTTLIEQLEVLNNVMAIDGTNIITSIYESDNAPVIINSVALQKGGN